jgi:hypothetical protein
MLWHECVDSAFSGAPRFVGVLVLMVYLTFTMTLCLLPPMAR